MATPTKRVDGIDFWRGLALLTIFIDHLPENVFQHVTQKNFGFSDAADRRASMRESRGRKTAPRDRHERGV